MTPSPPRASPLVVALTVITALSVCAIFAAVTVPAMLGDAGAWPVLIGGMLGLVLALAALLLLHRRRDRSLW
jgi:hypothetical protein